jgi:hypothetical protein
MTEIVAVVTGERKYNYTADDVFNIFGKYDADLIDECGSKSFFKLPELYYEEFREEMRVAGFYVEKE